MKTPREILLNRHRAAEPALDSIRQGILAGELGRTAAASANATGPGWLTVLWQQLVLPCRSAWVGVAAAWGVVLLLRLAAVEPARFAEYPTPKRAGATRAELKQQWLLRAELLGIATARPEPPAATPGPQSEAAPVRTTVLRQEETSTV